MAIFGTTALIIFAIITGSLSLVGSSLLICTILRSRKKLSVPYRRFIFCTSIYDFCQSLGLTTSIFLSPKDTLEWAIGNTTTCDIQGFFTTVGAIGVPMYLCSLCIYYLCIIKLNLRKQTFKKVEPVLHAVPILYSFACGTFALSKQYYNNAGSVCYVAPAPITCEIFPDEACIRGEGASRFRLLFLTYPSMVIFVIVCVIMAIITCTAKKIEKRGKRHSFPRAQLFSTSESSFDGGTEDSKGQMSTKNGCQLFGSKIMNKMLCLRSPSSSKDNGGIESSIPTEVNPSSSSSARFVSNRRRRNQKTSDKMGEINKQASLYVASYILSYGFVWATSLYILATNQRPPKALRVLSAIFFPLQGFINIFIYCRPHIVSFRKQFPDKYTWFQAFIMVLKSGGDDPLTSHERRASSMQRLQTVQNSSSSYVRREIICEMDMSSSDANSVGSMAALQLENIPSESLQIDIENQSEKESYDNFEPYNSADPYENEGEEGKIIHIPIGALGDMAATANLMPEISFPDESTLNCRENESSNFLSKSFQDPSTSSTDTSCDNEDENGEIISEEFTSADGITESLEDVVRSAEQIIDDSLEEFLTLAGKEEK